MNKAQFIQIVKRYFVPFVLIIFSHIVSKAQNDSVVIVKSYIPTISDAFKINDNPKIQDSLVGKINLNYKIYPKLYPVKYDIEPIKAAKMIGEPLAKFYKAYVKTGFGTKATPIAEIYFNNLRATDRSIGAYFKHLSSSGKIKDYAFPGFSDNEAVVYAHTFYENHALSADINYNRNIVHYYGFKPSDFANLSYADDKDSIRQRFSKIGGQLKFMSTYHDTTKFNHSFQLSYLNFSDIYNAVEDYIGFKSVIDKNINILGITARNQNISLKTNVDYYNELIKVEAYSGTVIQLLPHFSASYNIINYNLGLNASIKSAEITKTFIYPDIDVKLKVYKNLFIIYGGTTGELKRNNLIDFSSENPFINTNLPFAFTSTDSKIYGGFKGSLSSELSFNISISKSKVKNLPLFVNDTSCIFQNKFSVIYDDAKIFNTHTEITYNKSEKINIMLISNFYQYTMSNEIFAWHKPNMDMKFSFQYNLKSKIILKTDIFAFGNEDVKEYNPDNILVVKPVRLKGAVDFNLGVEYRYTKILSAFINFNNVGAVKYQRWNNYPSYGFNILAGITYAF